MVAVSDNRYRKNSQNGEHCPICGLPVGTGAGIVQLLCKPLRLDESGDLPAGGLLCLCFPLQALTNGEGLRKKLGGLYCTAAQSVGLAVLLVLCVLTAQLPGGVINTVILQERGAFSTRGIYAEVENFSANIPDNTFAVGRDVESSTMQQAGTTTDIMWMLRITAWQIPKNYSLIFWQS